MSLQRPAWLKEHLKKQVPDQITILNKSSMYAPMSTGNGRDGKPQVAMPVNRMLHEKETVLNAATTDALGGQKGVQNLVMSNLRGKGINQMPMPRGSTIRQAASNNMAKAGYVMGTMPQMRQMAGYITGTLAPQEEPLKTVQQAAPAIMPEMKTTLPTMPAPTQPTNTIPFPSPPSQFDDMFSVAPTQTAEKAQTYDPLPFSESSDYTNNTRTGEDAGTEQARPTATPQMPAVDDGIAGARLRMQQTYDPASLTRVPATSTDDGIAGARLRMQQIYDPASLAQPTVPATTGDGGMTVTRNRLALETSGFTNQADYDRAAAMGIFTKKDYDAEMAARSAPAPTTGTGTSPQMPNARGMNTFRQQYDYAAQQADARSAASAQALGMRMAQNPNLTQGAQNTMLQEQMMAKGAQQSKLAGDAAQSAYGIQRDQNRQAMDAMLAAGDVDGYAGMFQQEFGVPINKDAMKSAVNQKAFSNGMSQLNTYVAQFGEKANINDPITSNMLKSVWAATGNIGEMDQAWANTFLENVKQSQSPIYQALNAYPESEAREIWGTAIDGLTDPLTGKTGYAAFKSLFARDMTKGFMTYDPATGDFKVLEGGALQSLFLGSTGTKLGTGVSLTNPQNPDAPAAPTFTYSTIKTGDTVDYNGEKWTIGTDVDGKKIMRSESGKWANVGSDDILNEYTTSNTTGIQTIGGKTYNNGTEITATVAGKPLAINKDGEGNFVTVGTQRVPVKIGADGAVKIEGSFVDAGKLYVDGKEIKANGASLNLPDTAIEAFKGGYPVVATVGGKTYKVTNDGAAPTLYSTEDFIADPTPENLAAAIQNESADEVFTAYENKLKTNVDPAYINSLIEAGSPKAKEYAIGLITTGKALLKNLPTLFQHFNSNTDTSSTNFSNIQNGDASAENAAITSARFTPGKSMRIDGQLVYVKNYGNRYVDPSGSKDYREHTLTYIDLATGKEITKTWKIGDF